LVVPFFCLLQACNQILVTRCTFDEFRQVLAVFDKVNSTPFPNDEEDIVLGFAGRFADDADDACRQLTLLVVGTAKSPYARPRNLTRDIPVYHWQIGPAWHQHRIGPQGD
jgi:hypothetical protein